MSTISGGNAFNCFLGIQAPHWMSLIRVYNHLFEKVAQSRGRLDLRLPPGVYEVEATLGLEKERQLVAVRPDRQAFIDADSWTLRYRSAAPLRGSSTTLPAQEEGARRWSREATLERHSDGESRLFVFVRAIDTESRLPEDVGLRLLDHSGAVLTDFTDGVRADPENNYMALTWNLPPGPYMLQTKAPPRYQPLWLSPGYETHAFVPFAAAPNLGAMSLSMTRKGEGFDPDNDDLVAAELTWQLLQRKQELAGATYFYRDDLVQAAGRNPWLSILAAHAARTLEHPSRDVLLTYLLVRLLEAHPRLSDHPDVSALTLNDEAAAVRRFDFPPMLWRSLSLAQSHAALHAETIPLGSQTDRVLDSLVLDGPWSAWRDIDYEPSYVRDEASFRRVLAEAEENPDEVPLYSSRLRAHEDRALMRLAQSLSFAEQLPEFLALPENNLLKTLTDVEPREVSRECGITVGRAEEAINFLRRRPSAIMQPEILSPSTQAAAAYIWETHVSAEESPDEHASVDFSLEEAGRRLRLASAEFARQSAMSDKLAAGFPLDFETVEFFLSTLARLLLKEDTADDFGDLAWRLRELRARGETAGEDDLTTRLLGLLIAEWSSRLADAADRTAEFDTAILITDEEGRVRSYNSALRYILGLGTDKVDDDYFRGLVNLLSYTPKDGRRLSIYEFYPGSPAYHDQVLSLPRVGVRRRGWIVAYLYLLHTDSHRALDAQTLRLFDHLTSSVALHQTLLEYGAPEQRPAYVRALGRDIGQILFLLDGPETASSPAVEAPTSGRGGLAR